MVLKKKTGAYSTLHKVCVVYVASYVGGSVQIDYGYVTGGGGGLRRRRMGMEEL